MSALSRSDLAATFADPDVADAYQYRPPYPAEVFDRLERLMTGQPRPRYVLDIGAGDGALARPLADRADRVDALDISAAMLAAGARRPGGDRANLRWILGAAEAADLDGPYALVTAGASLHWMQWQATLARLASAMSDSALLVIVEHGHHQVPWQQELAKVITRHSRSPDYDPGFSLADELSARGLLRLAGRATTEVAPFRQPVCAYVEQFHSTASLARTGMPARESAEFDAAIRALVEPYSAGGILEMKVRAELAWGRPIADSESRC